MLIAVDGFEMGTVKIHQSQRTQRLIRIEQQPKNEEIIYFYPTFNRFEIRRFADYNRKPLDP